MVYFFADLHSAQSNLFYIADIQWTLLNWIELVSNLARENKMNSKES